MSLHVGNIGFGAIFMAEYPDAFFQLVHQFIDDVVRVGQIAKGASACWTGGGATGLGLAF